MGHYLGNSPFVQVEKDFAKAIEKQTHGKVEIDMNFAGGLGKGNVVSVSWPLTFSSRMQLVSMSVVFCNSFQTRQI